MTTPEDEEDEDRKIGGAKRKPKTAKLAAMSLYDFVTTVSPEFAPPLHLAAWVHQFELVAQGLPVRALCALPIRHWKSLSSLHGLAWILCKDPTLRILILTHSFDRSRSLGKKMRKLAEVAGVGPVLGYNMIESWTNAHGGGVITMSADQSRLGEDVHLVLFDDPLDEHASMDQARRDSVDETISHYTARCMRRGKPGPVLGVMSRWHPDDPIGRRLLREHAALPWVYIHKPAIVDEGLPSEHAFAPNVWPLDALKKMRAELAEQDPTERIWWAQLMGDPKPPGSALFRADPARWSVQPDWTFRLAFGADLAFTQGATSDYFAIVVAKIIGARAFLLEVMRTRLDAHQIESTCKAFQNKYGRGPIFTYVSGPEVGMVRLMRERGIPFHPLKARYNKLVRAERTIKRWNDEQIIVPAAAPWAPGFLHRVEMFRGEDKGHDDDEIDALVSLCDGAMGGVAGGGVVKTLGRSYPGV
ncbi:MAG TPA: phage terminase large subunit [Candidatus Polarisedimenticolia bacterium]|nr:phage terminase large subunit [Candidatus Polarisedimenticolia bacterium]